MKIVQKLYLLRSTLTQLVFRELGWFIYYSSKKGIFRARSLNDSATPAIDLIERSNATLESGKCIYVYDNSSIYIFPSYQKMQSHLQREESLLYAEAMADKEKLRELKISEISMPGAFPEDNESLEDLKYL